MAADGVLAVVIGRAGSKGLPGKNARQLAGRPMIRYAIDDARAAACGVQAPQKPAGRRGAEGARGEPSGRQGAEGARGGLRGASKSQAWPLEREAAEAAKGAWCLC